MVRFTRTTRRFCVHAYTHKRWRCWGKPIKAGLIIWKDWCIWNIIFLSTDCRRDNAHGLGLVFFVVVVGRLGQLRTRNGADNQNLVDSIHALRRNVECEHVCVCVRVCVRPNGRSLVPGTDSDIIYVRNQYYRGLHLWVYELRGSLRILHSSGATIAMGKTTPLRKQTYADQRCRSSRFLRLDILTKIIMPVYSCVWSRKHASNARARACNVDRSNRSIVDFMQFYGSEA